MSEVIDLCDTCDEDGCEQDFEHCDKDGQFLLSGDNDENELQTNNVAYELQINDDDDKASIAANELQVIDLSRSLHDVTTPWTAKLPFDVEFDGHQGNFDIMKFTEGKYKWTKIYFPVQYCEASHRKDIIKDLNESAQKEDF